jgi:hypothetical protein
MSACGRSGATVTGVTVGTGVTVTVGKTSSTIRS